jgi:hypothetical protein
MTFNTHLKASTTALRPLPPALWNIVCPMVAHITKGDSSVASDNYLRTNLNMVNKDLEAYFRHILTGPKPGDRWRLVQPARASLIQYMDQIFTQGVVAQSSIERRFPDFWEGLKSLQSTVTAPTLIPKSSRLSTVSRSETLIAKPY